jgi:hypothetical protein
LTLMSVLDLVRYQLRYGSKGLKILHVDNQIIVNSNILRVIKELEKHGGFLIWQDTYFLDLLSVGVQLILRTKSIRNIFLLF